MSFFAFPFPPRSFILSYLCFLFTSCQSLDVVLIHSVSLSFSWSLSFLTIPIQHFTGMTNRTCIDKEVITCNTKTQISYILYTVYTSNTHDGIIHNLNLLSFSVSLPVFSSHSTSSEMFVTVFVFIPIFLFLLSYSHSLTSAA